MIDIVRGIVNNARASQEVVSVMGKLENYTGTLYLGYPLSSTNESSVTIDALLVTREKGLIAFIFGKAETDPRDSQDLLYYQITNTLTKYESLRIRRGLAIIPTVITIYPAGEEPESDDQYLFCGADKLESAVLGLPDFDEKYYAALCEALQKISSMKPRKRRLNVTTDRSRGGIIKKIEKEIANLDEWQKKAAFETPDEPQRVRGLAGSGKTVVLALKAAYLHAQHPTWNIAVTYYTRSLSQQLITMISNFSYEFLGDLPDWERLHVIHAWGTELEIGVYSELSQKMGVIPLNYNGAKAKYGRAQAFDGVCNELMVQNMDNIQPYYDAILIDEAQDMPKSFFRLCYKIVKHPKRVVFAYDELQNLNNVTMPTLGEMFGFSQNGEANVTLKTVENEARQDIVLPICYRNTPWALSLAHSLGFGIYRKEGLVQLFSDLDLWEDIGYKVTGGELSYGKKVKLERKSTSAPQYFVDLIDKDDAIIARMFSDVYEQYDWVAAQIEKNLTEEELDPDDILVIFPEAYYAKRQYTAFRDSLLSKGINSILAGVSANRDTFKVDGCITCSSIYRAKGNEAPMVYIVNSEFCARGPEMITLRNTLFTAITRSRAWVRICGVGADMEVLCKEIKKCTDNNYQLEFTVPTIEELEKMRLIHRDRTEAEKKKLKEDLRIIKKLRKSAEKGELDPSVIPELAALMQALGNVDNIDNIEDDEDE